MTSSLLTILALLLGVQLSWASGDEKGNGGGAVQCPGQALELFDFFEARQTQLGTPDLGSGDSVAELSEVYLSRLATTSPQRAAQFRRWLGSFQSEAVFMASVPIGDINDLGTVIPAGCQWRQIVNQNPLLLPAGKKYLVDENAWNELLNLQKVGLMFHEFFYRQSNSRTSKGVRFLNSLIATNRLGDFNLSKRLGLFTDAGLSWMEAQGVAFQINSEVQIVNEKLVTARAVANSEYLWQGQSLVLRDEKIDFFETGFPKALCISGAVSIQLNGQDYSIGCTPGYTPPLEFHANGNFKAGSLWGPGELGTPDMNLSFTRLGLDSEGRLQFFEGSSGNVFVDGKPYLISPESRIDLYSNGRIQRFYFHSRSGDDQLWVWGQPIHPKENSPLNFNEDGALLDFVSAQKGSLKTPTGALLSFDQDEHVVLQAR